jgi:predicted aspartyl protease
MDRSARVSFPDAVVDTGSEYTWVPRALLEGLNLKVDPVRKELVPAGPVITASAA